MRLLKVVAAMAVVVAIAGVYLFRQLPDIAAGGLLYPQRHHLLTPRPANCEDVRFNGEGVATGTHRPTTDPSA